MTDMLINCDTGERGISNETDLAIMPFIDVANIACGGHAGDASSVRFFLELAQRRGVIVSAHLSYPDRVNFGRASMQIGSAELRHALDIQFKLMMDTRWLKFHGALYNDSCHDEPLAATLADWAEQHGITHVVTQGDSALAVEARARKLVVVSEVYAERRYTLNDQGRLCLVPRNKPYASIAGVEEALEQARQLIQKQSVQAVVGEHPDGSPILETRPLPGQTICVHSDSAIALQLVIKLSALIRGTMAR